MMATEQYLAGLPPERRCPVCKKRFCARDDWAYTRGKRERKTFFCSWRCLQEFDKKNDRVKGRKPNRMAKDILDMASAGASEKEICEALGVTVATVRYHRYYGALYNGGTSDEVRIQGDEGIARQED